jgi:hypothetical protein
VTEIPEHLLKRSQARRGAAGDAAPASDAATPATTAAAAPAVAAPKAPAVPAGPPPAKPDIPVVAAYKERKKIPVWAMLTLSIFPLWAFLYVLALRPEPVKAVGPLGVGTTTYSGCAGCHGNSGEGGIGYAFVNGSVTTTFPHIEDQLRWVKLGSDAYKNAGVQIAGDPNREGGAHIAGATGVMPAQAAGLSDARSSPSSATSATTSPVPTRPPRNSPCGAPTTRRSSLRSKPVRPRSPICTPSSTACWRSATCRSPAPPPADPAPLNHRTQVTWPLPPGSGHTCFP